MLYNKATLEYFGKRSNAGFIDNADGIGEVGNFNCGDVIRIDIKFDDDIISEAKYSVFGGASAIACASAAVDFIIGKTAEEALTINSGIIDRTLEGLPANRLQSAVFACEAVQSAIKNYYDKNGIKYDPFDFAIGCSLCEGCFDLF